MDPPDRMPFFLWLDANHTAQYVLRYAALVATIVLAMLPLYKLPGDTPRRLVLTRILFLVMVVVTLFTYRWSSIFPSDRIDNDEALVTAYAITAAHDPIPWKEWDPVLAGPLPVWTSALPAGVGLTPSFQSTRTIGLLLFAASLIFLFFALRVFFDEAACRCTLIPPLLLFALVTELGYLGYAPQFVAMALWALAAMLLARSHQRGLSRSDLLFAAFVAGLLPFAVLQSLPIAVATLALSIALIEMHPEVAEKTRRARTWSVVAAFAAPSLFFAVAAVLTGVFPDFLTSYVREGFANRFPGAPPITWLLWNETLKWYVLSTLLLTLLGAFFVWRTKTWTWPTLGASAFAAIWLGAGIFAAYRPNIEAPHSLYYVILPLAACAGCALGTLLNAVQTVPDPKQRTIEGSVAAGVFVLVTVLAQGALVPSTIQFSGSPTFALASGEADGNEQFLKRTIKPGSRAAIWGGHPEMFVSTRTLMGTRDAFTQYQQFDQVNPFKDYYRRRYIADFEKTNPEYFVDFEAHPSSDSQLNTFPELGSIISRDYHPIAEYQGIRVYERGAK